MLDDSEVRELAVDLSKAGENAMGDVRKVAQKGALNIKTDWRKAWTGHPHFPALPYAIGYDTTETATSVEAEIGPDKNKRQGALGNIIEFGTVKNPPIPGGAPALDAEAPRFEQALADLGVKAIAP